MTTSLTSNGTTAFEQTGGGGGGNPSPVQQSPQHSLLHRSPSGAQRKIRQKAQQQQQQQQQFGAHQQFSSSSNGVQPTPSNSVGGFGHQQMAYRNLIRENGYRSILGSDGERGGGGEQPILMDPSPAANFSVGQLIDRMNRLDPFPHQKSQSIDSSWLLSSGGGGGGGGSIDKMPSAMAPLEGGQPVLAFSKPTVQVYPLPVPPRHRSMSVISTASSSSCSPQHKPMPPPLPPKKHSLMMAQFAMAAKRNGGGENGQNEEAPPPKHPSGNWQSAVLLSGASSQHSSASFSHSQSSSAETEFAGFPEEKGGEGVEGGDHHGHHHYQQPKRSQQKDGQVVGGGGQPVLEAQRKEQGGGGGGQQKEGKTTKGGAGGAAGGSPFFSPPPSLSSSPSLTSLQNSLHFAVENPEKHSWEQLQELDQRRLQSIDSLAKKAAEREQDRQLLCRDLEEVEQLKCALFSRVSHNHQLLGRLQTFLAETKKMAELETMLQCQMLRLSESGGGAANGQGRRKRGAEREDRAEWAKRLREQLNDVHFLRGMTAARERQLDAEMAEELGEAEALHEWFFCKEQLGKLCAERRQLEERLRDVRELIQSLQAICLLPQGTPRRQPNDGDDDEEEEEEGE